MTTTSDPTSRPLPEDVRTTLTDLAREVGHLVTRIERLMGHPLTTSQHPTATTLRALGVTRTALTTLDQHSRHYPVGHHAYHRDHYATLSDALDDIASTLLPSPDTTVLRACLSTLPALALTWLTAVNRVKRTLLRHLDAAGDTGETEGLLRRSIHSRDRIYVTEALEQLVEEGLVNDEQGARGIRFRRTK